MREITSIKDIRTAIRELSVRAELARRVEGYREELGHRR
jgi:hypothetical protein